MEAVIVIRRAVVRDVVQPVIGEDAWQRLRKAQRELRRTRARRAKVRARVRELKRQLREEELLAAAKRLEKQRAGRELARMSDDLTLLAKHFRTDKWGDHRYTPHYQHHLAHLRDRPMSLLEIGIGGYARAGDGGGSLRMWKHFFPLANIYGLDVEDKSFVEEPRIRAFQGDQSDRDLLHRIVAEIGRPNVIIDDGSHRPEHVIATFETLFPLLADDGIYVVEDTQTSYWPEWGGHEDPDNPTTSMAMLKRLADGLNYEEYVDDAYEPSFTDRFVVGVHFYHNLVFIEKGTNAEGTRRRRILRDRYAQPVS
jgi:hypothetical protein